MATTGREPGAGRVWWRWGPELALAVLAGALFLGFLGSIDVWGKREQRAGAEALDTIDQHHWLVAQIQGRPRLEKPPLPRWTIAALVTLTGRRDAGVIRLPAALSGLGMVGLVYALGRRLGGRPVGLASGLVLASTGFFLVEMRQSGNDGPLAFFTTLALYAAWRRLHGAGTTVSDDPAEGGGRGWARLFHVALGLGFLCKGPVVLLVTTLTLVPYLLCARRLGTGLRRLADGWGLLLFAVLALSWPVPVLLNDPNALRVWILEMGQKAGTAGIAHRPRQPLAVSWPEMTAPWLVIATGGALLPFARRLGAAFRPRIWFPWWWAMGNLVMFCGWSVAKTNYFLPCLPGAALLAGLEWVRMTRAAREGGRPGVVARLVLQGHWVVLFVAAMVAPAVVYHQVPAWWPWVAVGAAAVAAGVVLSAVAWHRGADAGALAPLTAGLAVALLVVVGAIAPRENDRRSHRALAATLDRLLPPDARTVMFYHELDEGLWFYLKGRTLVPVPGSHPEYNDAYRYIQDLKRGTIEWNHERRATRHLQSLVDWLRQPEHASPYVLVQRAVYDRYAATLDRYTDRLLREPDLARHEVVLLRVKERSDAPASLADVPADGTRRQ